MGTLWKAFKQRDDFRIMVLPDHATPVSVRTHTTDPIPFAISGKDVKADEASAFTEKAAKAGKLDVKEGFHLMKHLIKGV